ncbi:MAG: hypothetical protein RMM51_04025 [Verrucomicrobiae bacterium]|nr:hypothetical protein [Verrucomicrobiae bacterium]
MKTETLSRILLPILTGLVSVLGLTTALAVRKASRLAHQLTAISTTPVASAAPSDAQTDRIAVLESLVAERDATIARLRAELEQRRQPTESVIPTPTRPAPSTTSPPPPTTGASSWLEQLRQQDPERFERIQAALEQRRQAAEQWFDDQYQRLEQRLQTITTASEADLVMQISEQLQRLEELGQRWWQLREVPDEQRREAAESLREETRETMQTLQQLMQQDRQLQLQKLARQIGYRDDAAVEQFVESVNAIIRDTELRSLRPPWAGGRGGGFGPGPGGAPTP